MSLRNRTAEEENGKTLVRDKRDRAITCVSCRDPHLTLTFSGRCKNICLKESEVWRTDIQTKLLSRLSHKVCSLLSSPVLLRKFATNPVSADGARAYHSVKLLSFLK